MQNSVKNDLYPLTTRGDIQRRTVNKVHILHCNLVTWGELFRMGHELKLRKKEENRQKQRAR